MSIYCDAVQESCRTYSNNTAGCNHQSVQCYGTCTGLKMRHLRYCYSSKKCINEGHDNTTALREHYLRIPAGKFWRRTVRKNKGTKNKTIKMLRTYKYWQKLIRCKRVCIVPIAVDVYHAKTKRDWYRINRLSDYSYTDTNVVTEKIQETAPESICT